jgi:uncharacterized membrane protein
MKSSPALFRAHYIFELPSVQAAYLHVARFLYYSLIGWLVETSFILITRGYFPMRGLTDYKLPLIPLFGYAGLIIIRLLSPLKKKPLLVFAGAVVLTTLAELMTSLLNTFLFSRKTWSYENVPLSIGGFIAVPISIGWGLLVIFVFYCVDPALRRLISHHNRIPHIMVCFLLALYCLICMFYDFVNIYNLI